MPGRRSAAGGRLSGPRRRALLRVLAGAAILSALGTRLGTDAVVDGLRAVDLSAVLAALAVGLLTTVCNAWRWCLVARGLGLRLLLGPAVADCYRAVFLNSVLPAGVLGDVHRAVHHGRQTGDVGRGLRAVAIERCAGFVVLTVVGLGVLFARPALLAAVFGGLGGGLDGGLGVRLGVGLTAGTLAVLVGLGVLAVRAPGAKAVLRPGPAEVGSTGLARGTWPAVVLLSAAAVAAYLALFVVAARTAGSHTALGELLPLLVLALLAMGLPINIGGWGPREAVAAGAFGTVGLDAAQGLTVAVVYGALSLVACLPGLGVLLLRRPPRVQPTVGDGAPRSTSLARC